MKVRRDEVHSSSEPALTDELGAFMKDATEGGVLVAHGAADGAMCAQRPAAYFRSSYGGRHIWLHACESARRIAPAMAEAGVASYGFCTKILMYSNERVELEHVEAELAAAGVDDDAVIIAKRIQRRWHESAKEALQAGRILRAAVLTHLELHVRAFPRKR